MYSTLCGGGLVYTVWGRPIVHCVGEGRPSVHCVGKAYCTVHCVGEA